MNTMMVEQAYEQHILDPDVHGRLLLDIERICKRAKIPSEMVLTPLGKYCTDKEVDWVRNIKRHRKNGIHGMYYTGDVDNLEYRMMAIAGALIRNFIDARVYSLLDVLKNYKDGDSGPTVVLVPNFYTKGQGLAKWQIQQLHDWMISRMTEDKINILYVEDVLSLESDYGPVFRSHLEKYTAI